MSNVISRLETVAKFASKDVTRPNLGFCVYESKLQGLVATDGHRLIVDKGMAITDPFNASVYLKTKETLTDKSVTERYPNVVQFIPSLNGYSELIKFTVPDWFKALEKLKGKPIGIHFYGEGLVGFGREAQPTCKFTLDARLMGALAGQALNLRYKDDKCPVHFEYEFDTDIYGVIMPMRA